jgi:hypothetical protein
VKCVYLLTQSDQEEWAVYGWVEKIRTILINALQSSDKQTIQETKELTNRLVLYGYTQFLDLLR